MKDTMQQVPILSIKMVPAGVELVLNALNRLPREIADGLYGEIFAQYSYQMQEPALESIEVVQDHDPAANEELADPVPATTN
jgi:hypothetical protein